ncbi:hypothetical protein [Infirmifilum sp.]|uniref:hypothetical protein n=1 Tax=Infirmifilum sp. TaxID=2856575 RepID=UPI003D0C6E71
MTTDSHIDVAVVVKELPRSSIGRAEILDKVWKIMESRGVPWWYPFEILITHEDLKLLGKTKAYQST